MWFWRAWDGVYFGAHRLKPGFEQSILRTILAIAGREEHEPLSEQMVIILVHSIHHSQSREYNRVRRSDWEVMS
jgi:hypothetical protein